MFSDREAAERGAIDLVRWVISHTVGRIEVGDGTILTAIEDRATKGAGVVREAEKGLGLACARCFPAGTMVATPHGERAIQTLHVGDAVLAENPTSGKVEAEAAQAVIADPVSPLIAVQLSDGSAITVTADHPFWVDAGVGLTQAGWLAAGRLHIGDVLRTVSGLGVMVVELRWQAGNAAVYTLTVAKDHTYFVGAARVLVHNCDLKYEGSPKHHENAGPGIGDAPANGQAALDNSVQVKSTSTRRVGVDPETGQIVVFDETHPGQGIYHGHVRTWDELTQEMKNALVRAGLVNIKGRPIP